MDMPEIKVTHYIEGDSFKGTFSHSLRRPWLPDGCEKCGVYKGSCFEVRLMCLVPNDRPDTDTRFLCEPCFVDQENKAIRGNRRSVAY